MPHRVALQDDSWATPRMILAHYVCRINTFRLHKNDTPEEGDMHRYMQDMLKKKACTHFQHSGCKSHKTLHSWNCSSPPGNTNSVNVIRLRDITVMCLMQHNHIPRRAYKTNLSVPAGLSKTRTVINCLQASEIVCISTPSRWQNTGGCPVGKFYLTC